jgi:mRNA interferase RelE/StbE
MKLVRYHPDALRSLKRHGNVASRIRRAIEEYAAKTGPHSNSVTRLVGSTASRLRVGDFRAIFEETDTEIFVTKIAARGSAYD